MASQKALSITKLYFYVAGIAFQPQQNVFERNKQHFPGYRTYDRLLCFLLPNRSHQHGTPINLFKFKCLFNLSRRSRQLSQQVGFSKRAPKSWFWVYLLNTLFLACCRIITEPRLPGWPPINLVYCRSSELRSMFTDTLNRATQNYSSHTPLRMIQVITLLLWTKCTPSSHLSISRLHRCYTRTIFFSICIRGHSPRCGDTRTHLYFEVLTSM